MAAPASPTPPVWTIKALLAWTADFLARKGADAGTARLESQVLLAHVLSCPRIELVARSDEIPADDARTTFRELIKRRADGCPVAYLTGHKEFYLLNFEVSPAVLIPRPDTETLVAQADKLLKPLPAPRVLDLCAGSGCIGVTLAHRLKKAQVRATDVSPEAAAVAARNAATHGVSDRVRVAVGDLFDAVPEGETFDLIASNPPYVADAEFAGLDVGVRDHEPRLALAGGPDGLAFYRRIAAGVTPFLAPGGHLLLEIGETQAEAVGELLAAAGLDVTGVLKDGARRPRVVAARRK